MRKIIFITREGYDLAGARIRCYNFAREVSRSGIPTEILSFSDHLGAKDGHRESEMNLFDKLKYNYSAFKRISKEKDALFYIQRINYHCLAPLLAHILNKKMITLDLDDWEMREDPRYYLGFYPSSKAHFLTAYIARRSHFCIAASRFPHGFLLKFNKTVHYIPTGVDCELFKPSGSGTLRSNRIVLSWIGTFHRKEYLSNLKMALDCFAMLRRRYDHIYFEIVGDGIYRNDLEKMVADYEDLNITLKGWIPPQLIPEYLDTVDIGLFPVAERNNFNEAKSPTKLFEYMSMQKPTVSSLIGECRHIIKDGENGLTAKDKAEFFSKMRMLIEDRYLGLKIGTRSRQTVEDSYSLRVLGQRLREIFSRL